VLGGPFLYAFPGRRIVQFGSYGKSKLWVRTGCTAGFQVWNDGMSEISRGRKFLTSRIQPVAKKNMNSLIPPDCKIDSFLLEYDLLSGYFVTNKFNNPDFLLTHVKKPE
jgi:hypothetical protein